MLESVAEIFLPIRPDLPMPVTTDAAFAGEEQIDGTIEGGIEAREEIADGLRFDAQDAAGGVQAHRNVTRDSWLVTRGGCGAEMGLHVWVNGVRQCWTPTKTGRIMMGSSGELEWRVP